LSLIVLICKMEGDGVPASCKENLGKCLGQLECSLFAVTTVFLALCPKQQTYSHTFALCIPLAFFSGSNSSTNHWGLEVEIGPSYYQERVLRTST
jgi:hypothetical protein